MPLAPLVAPPPPDHPSRYDVCLLLLVPHRYFAPAGSNTKGSLKTALGHAFGPSFGSLCLASWLLNLLNMLKSMAQNARAENRDNFLVQILVSCFEFLLTVSYICSRVHFCVLTSQSHSSSLSRRVCLCAVKVGRGGAGPW
jgi:hypothetical protein